MDVVYSALTPHINVLCVVCSDDSKLEAVKTHARIILNKIFDDSKKSYAHVFNPHYFVRVSRVSRFTKKATAAIKRQIKNELAF